MRQFLTRWLNRGLFAVAMVLVVIQVLPYGRNQTNPPVVLEPLWDSEQTRRLAVAACYDCHSNETVWPWYSKIAPLSWLIERDVVEGRAELNFSEWNRPQDEADDAADTVWDREMPPRQYLLMHPEARLTDDQLAALARGLEATIGD